MVFGEFCGGGGTTKKAIWNGQAKKKNGHPRETANDGGGKKIFSRRRSESGETQLNDGKEDAREKMCLWKVCGGTET